MSPANLAAVSTYSDGVVAENSDRPMVRRILCVCLDTGRVPGSVNVPAGTLLDSKTKAFVPLEQARAEFAAMGIDKSKDVICYCGGGISATVDLFMLHQLGYDRIALYDGSMGEWAKDESLPIETD